MRRTRTMLLAEQRRIPDSDEERRPRPRCGARAAPAARKRLAHETRAQRQHHAAAAVAAQQTRGGAWARGGACRQGRRLAGAIGGRDWRAQLYGARLRLASAIGTRNCNCTAGDNDWRARHWRSSQNTAVVTLNVWEEWMSGCPGGPPDGYSREALASADLLGTAKLEL